jgi:transcriptional regulator with XRE-family HTH domain
MADGVDPHVPEPLAARVDKLFQAVRRPDGREYSHREIAEAITAAGEPISHSYIGQLRAGDKDNPTLRHLRALARFFGVPVEYFTSDVVAAEVNRELDVLAALKELRVQTVALRQSVLPEAKRSLAQLSRIMDAIRELDQGDAPGATPDRSAP